MAAKLKTHPLNGAHTAGIFADMTVDGPPIGTLVLVVDRAKNLPNRKTIGKQDPYCAARLGKEAKKTNTDIRGGQTPRWDQELRFIVHDSPDYYQLKISVFNDDKKTELIGETWIDLRDIIVTGGGQNDLWHQLSCRGKYAGEIRIEITFYDSRPPPEKPAVKAKPPMSSEVDGPARPGSGKPAGPKRRPLPNGPSQVTGKASPAHPGPEPATQTPTRPQPSAPLAYIPNQSPLQQMEYNNPPPGPRYHQQDAYAPAQVNLSAYGGSGQHTDHSPQHYRTPERRETYHHYDERNGNPNMQIPSYERLHQHQQSHQGRNDMYHVDERGVSPEDDRPPPPPVHRSRHNSGPAAHDQMVIRNGYDAIPPKGTPSTIRHEVLRNEAHRQSQSASSPSGGAYPGQPTYRPYNPASSSTSAIPQYSSPGEVHHPSPPRHQSYDAAYETQHRSMQPTVEDVPESPDQYNSFRRSGSRMPQYESPSQSQYEPAYEHTASPAPLHLQGRGSSTSLSHDDQPSQDDRHRRHSTIAYDEHEEQPQQVRGYPAQDKYQTPPPSNYTNDRGQQMLSYHNELGDASGSYGVPQVPSSLVPGIDHGLAMEISHRINEDRRSDRRYTQPTLVATRNERQSFGGGQNDYSVESPTGGYGSSQHSRGRTSQSYVPPPREYPVSDQPSPYSQTANRNPSPNPHHTIKRKSVSPAPPPSAGNETRRLSGVPFGPDDYNALNPAIAASTPQPNGLDYSEITGMIITHDGREVDPSDHLPMDTWAPEPEPKKPSAAPSPSARPSPAGPQSLPTSGRRPLRIAGRTSTTAADGYISGDFSFDASSSTPSAQPISTGRNRLQKKANRQSTAIPVMSGANGGFSTSPNPHSPLAPLPKQQDNYTPPRSLPRSQTFDDYPPERENHAPAYSPSPYDRRMGNSSSAPPIPDKVPLALPAPGGSRGYDEWGGMTNGAGGTGEDALLEEMRRIDLGTGTGRRGRRGHGYGY